MGVCGEAIVTIDVAVIHTYELVVPIEADEWPADEGEQHDLLSQYATEQFTCQYEGGTLPDPVAGSIHEGPWVQNVNLLTDPVQMVTDDLLRLAAELKE